MCLFNLSVSTGIYNVGVSEWLIFESWDFIYWSPTLHLGVHIWRDTFECPILSAQELGANADWHQCVTPLTHLQGVNTRAKKMFNKQCHSRLVCYHTHFCWWLLLKSSFLFQWLFGTQESNFYKYLHRQRRYRN